MLHFYSTFWVLENAKILEGDGEVIGGSSLYDMWSNSKACARNVKCWTNTGQKCFFFKWDVRPLQQRRATKSNKTAGWRPGPPCFFPGSLHWFTCVDKEPSMKFSKHTLMLQSHAFEVTVSFFDLDRYESQSRFLEFSQVQSSTTTDFWPLRVEHGSHCMKILQIWIYSFILGCWCTGLECFGTSTPGNFSKEALGLLECQPVRMIVKIPAETFVKADEMRLDALDASLEMFIRPELIFAKYESWFYYALYDISSDRHILNGFPTGLCVCGLSNDKITSTLLFLGLMASWNSFPVTCYSRISRPADVAFRISPMVLPGTPNGGKKSRFLRMKLGTSSRIYVVWSVVFFWFVWWKLSCCFQGYASTEQPSNCSSDLRWFDVWRCLICLLSHDCLMNVWERVSNSSYWQFLYVILGYPWVILYTSWRDDSKSAGQKIFSEAWSTKTGWCCGTGSFCVIGIMNSSSKKITAKNGTRHVSFQISMTG